MSEPVTKLEASLARLISSQAPPFDVVRLDSQEICRFQLVIAPKSTQHGLRVSVIQLLVGGTGPYVSKNMPSKQSRLE